MQKVALNGLAPPCAHKRFHSQSEVARLLVPMTDRVEFVFVCRVWCRDCGLEFGFKGVDNIEPGPDKPWTGAYGTTLRAPLEAARLAPKFGEKPPSIKLGD